MHDRYSVSRRLYDEASLHLAGGVSSNFRLNARPVPLFFERAEGATLYSADGVAYLDYSLGMGPVILGHAHPAVNERVRQSLDQGQLYAGQHAAESHLATLVSSLVPCAEQVRFGGSGSEVVQAAIRVARAFTAKTKIVKFEGHYHGWFDNIYVNVSVKGGDSPAAETNGQPRSSYSDTIDEVITGFRLQPSGAQGFLGVTPDLATMANAMANGFPISCLAGRAELMRLIGAGEVMHGGTYNSNVVAVQAALGTIDVLTSDNNAIYGRMEVLGKRLMKELRDSAAAVQIPLLVQGFGTVFNTAFTSASTIHYAREYSAADAGTQARFVEALLDRGVRITPRGTWFLSAAHTEADIENTIRIAADAPGLLR